MTGLKADIPVAELRADIEREMMAIHKQGILDGLGLAITACDLAISQHNLSGTAAKNFRELSKCLEFTKLKVEKEVK